MLNPREQRALRERQSALRFGLMLGSIGVGLLLGTMAVVGWLHAAPSSFWRTGVILAAVVLLVLRQLSRRLGSERRAIKPDPESTLHLH